MMEFPLDVEFLPLYIWIIGAVCVLLIIAGIIVLACRKKKKPQDIDRDGDMEVIHHASDVDTGLDMARDSYEAYEAEQEALERAVPVAPLTHWDNLPQEEKTQGDLKEEACLQEEPKPEQEASFAGFVHAELSFTSDAAPAPTSITEMPASVSASSSASEWNADQQLLLLKSHELLLTLSDGLKKLASAKTDAARKEKIAEMQAAMKILDAKNEWNDYKSCFEKVYPGFWAEIEASSSEEMSPYELRICALLSLGMGSKEIADLTNRSIRTVETTVYKIRKKLGMDTEEKTQEVLMRIRKNA
ncbi:MAG: helix-turn-helix transcriptional regulator [Bacteroidales bacterium]|nr:helix-turn-helix transcriptional regulator [Bacteroidales bacterium]